MKVREEREMEETKKVIEAASGHEGSPDVHTVLVDPKCLTYAN